MGYNCPDRVQIEGHENEISPMSGIVFGGGAGVLAAVQGRVLVAPKVETYRMDKGVRTGRKAWGGTRMGKSQSQYLNLVLANRGFAHVSMENPRKVRAITTRVMHAPGGNTHHAQTSDIKMVG